MLLAHQQSFLGVTLVHRTSIARLTPRRSNSVSRSAASAADTGMATGTTAEELRGQSCSLLGGCSSDTPKVPPEQLQQYMPSLPAWQLAEDHTSISKNFVAKNFVAAVKFFNRVAEVAEAEGHHPDLHLANYREVKVVLSTHAVGGLTMFDLIMAAKLDAVEVEYSPKWLKQNQHILGTPAASPVGPSS
eukprot:GHUV01007079.1.p1 GENE.GHUV01007079.1~~GHUV01007079.1.p1  ORF type:complete len:189 (+),score=46.19 GHUV01007079.1:128-694(+)